MELFKLFGTIAINNDAANRSIDETSEKAEKSESKIGKAFSKIGSAAVKMGKVAAIGVGTAAAGIATLTKKAVGDYADYEQLVGGVETLFKNSSKKVILYANQAYKTAGMSANKYMDTVTGFSASLLQSLDGDTSAAAEKANLAIIDMSDNANKMGTSMESIQNAYQGFAKQNYTMLDNLKLGYGGTKEEMERLLKDAEKISGYKFDLSSFGDIVDAIHVVQTEMDITGTTSKEAATTIQGSIGMMKSAWENLATGMADPDQDIGILMNNFVDSVVTVSNNVAPRIVETVPRVVEGLGMVVEAVIPYIMPLMERLIPSLLKGASSLISYLIVNLPSLIMMLGPTILDSISLIFEDINSKLPEEVRASVEKVKQALDHLKQAFQPVIDAVQPLIDKIEEYVSSGDAASDASTLVKTAVDGLATGIEFVSDVIDTLVNIVQDIVQGFKDMKQWCDENRTVIDLLGVAIGTITALIIAANAGQIAFNASLAISNGLMTVASVVEGITSAATTVWTTVSTAATAATSALGAAFAFLTSPIGLVILAIGAVIAVGVLLYRNWDTIKEKLLALFGRIKEVWTKIYSVIAEKVDKIKEKATNTFKKVRDAIVNPIEKARDTIKGVIDKIKAFFKFDVKLPKIKLPHFGIKPSGWQIGDLLKGSIPKLGIDWYAKAMKNPMLMTKPTAFGVNSNGQIMAGGEAGPEVVSGARTLMDMIKAASGESDEKILYYLAEIIRILTTYLPALASDRDVYLYPSADAAAASLAIPMDKALGKLQGRKDRGR